MRGYHVFCSHELGLEYHSAGMKGVVTCCVIRDFGDRDSILNGIDGSRLSDCYDGSCALLDQARAGLSCVCHDA